MSEWFMELVLKTSDTERYRRFESYSLRHYFGDIPKLGRRGSPAKGVDRDTGARVQISLSPPKGLHKIDAPTENPNFIGVFAVFTAQKAKVE